MEYECGTCGSRILVFYAQPDHPAGRVFCADGSPEKSHWEVMCGEGHPFVPYPGMRIEIDSRTQPL